MEGADWLRSEVGGAKDPQRLRCAAGKGKPIGTADKHPDGQIPGAAAVSGAPRRGPPVLEADRGFDRLHAGEERKEATVRRRLATVSPEKMVSNRRPHQRGRPPTEPASVACCSGFPTKERTTVVGARKTVHSSGWTRGRGPSAANATLPPDLHLQQT